MNDFIKKAYNGETDWWRYVLGFVFIFIIWQLGGVVHFIFVFIDLLNEGYTQNEAMSRVTNTSVYLGTLESNLNFFLLLLSFVFGTLGLLFTLKFIHQLKLKNMITSRDKIDWKRVFVAFGIISALVIGSTLYDYNTAPEDFVIKFQLEKFVILAIIGIILVPIQTTFEELLFRGYLLQGFGTMFKSRAWSLILTSTIFGLLHIANPEVGKLGYQALIVYIGTGFFLGILTLMDEGLELAIGFHAANNLITALLLTADWTAFQTNSIFEYKGEPTLFSSVYIPVFVIYPILILIFAKIYKWNNWSQRLFGKVEKPFVEDNLSEI